MIARKLPSLRDSRWMRSWAYRIATREAVHRTHSEKRWKEALRGDDLNVLVAEADDEQFDGEVIAEIVSRLDSLSPASQVVGPFTSTKSCSGLPAQRAPSLLYKRSLRSGYQSP